ncbi:DUF2469 family protein [Canibacter zhoujuaniae]|uniref:DUF2469 family protein n=1 Tax=Canibacter zhoujuaniae TaxID=2708343 RepID=UPI0014245370|nr:DUF2469 family protein [Canibacter zhoujuaniae]
MDDEERGDFEREAEQALFREYRDVVGQFRYAVETDRRFYLANEVEVIEHERGTQVHFELNLRDVWVWDIYRPDRFVKNARVLTFRDLNIEELNHQELQLPDALAFEE